MAKNNFQKGEIVIYKTPKNEVEVEVRFEKETVWLRQDEIARLYGKERSVITKQIFLEIKKWIKKAMCKNCTLLVLINRLLFIV